MSIDSNAIQENVKYLYNNLKQKECKGSNVKELIPAKDGLKILERILAFKNVKKTGEASFANQEAAGEFPGTIRKISKEKRYLSEHFLMQIKEPYSGGEMPQKTLVRKRSEHQDLRKGGIGCLYCFM